MLKQRALLLQKRPLEVKMSAGRGAAIYLFTSKLTSLKMNLSLRAGSCSYPTTGILEKLHQSSGLLRPPPKVEWIGQGLSLPAPRMKIVT